MIRCSEQSISEYIDGDLPAADAHELERHLWTCADCRALLLEYQTLVAVTRLLARQRQASGPQADAVKMNLTIS
jgi:anti-sigma factor RsiW